MIRLTRAVVAARPWHVLALFLLGLLAIGAAVAAPAYARMAQTSVAGSDVAQSSPRAESVTVTRSVHLRLVNEGGQVDADPGLLQRTMPDALRIDGFQSVYDGTVHAAGGASAADYTDPETGTLRLNAVLSSRSDACAHVVLVSGRCVAAPLEVMVTEATAKLLRGGTGTTLQLQYAVAVSTSEGVVYFPLGEPQTLSVVGVFHAPDVVGDPYWAGSAFAFAGTEELTGLIGPDTLSAISPYAVDQTYLAYPLPGALDPARLAAVRAEVTASFARIRATGRTPASQLPDLLDTIATDQRRAAVGPTVAGVPLVVLCWFVVFLAVAQTAQARRPELALLKLRGTAPLDRWWLSAAESMVPLVFGAVAGYFAGHLAVLAFGRATLAHPGPVQFTSASLLYAGTALVGALVFGLLALRRDLGSPVAELMRRVTRRTTRWQSAIIVAVVATLAAVAVFEARSNLTEDPTGLVLLGPALIVLAVGLLLAGLLDPIAERVGALALRRGRLALGLAALQMGRPRNSRRVVALLTIAVGLFVFAVTANDVSVRAREQQAAATLGAPRVLVVSAPDPAHLLSGVRSVDPDGRFAMAAEVLPADGRTGAALLAVDSSRLAAVAFWPGSATPQAAVKAIRPALANSVVVTGKDMLVDATFLPAPAVSDGSSDPAEFGPDDTIVAFFAPVAGGATIISTEARLQPGRLTYRLEMPCAAGCRLTGIAPHLNLNSQGGATVTLTAIRTGDGKTTLATGAELSHWLDRSRGTLAVRPQPAGLELQARVGANNDALVQPPDQTEQLPVVGAGTSEVQTLPTPTGNFFADNVITTTTLPRLGPVGGLGDLEVAVRDGVILLRATAEVWVNDAAPPDIVDRLAEAGLPVLSDRTLADAVADAGQRPNALGWRFFVVLGVLALALGIAGLLLATTVERRTRAYALRAMRTQGMPWRSVTAAGLIGYLSLVVCGLVFGAGAAMIAWWLDGAYLPIVEGRPLGQGLPGWPSSATTGWWVAAAATLVLVAIGATAALARGVRLSRQTEFGGDPTS